MFPDDALSPVRERGDFVSVRLAALSILLATVVSACSAGDAAAPPDSFSGAPLVTVATDAGKANIAIRTSPSPPTRGVNTIELSITDAHGAPVDGLTLTIVPWMPAHGHGASVKPSLTPLGHGVYLAHDVDLYMPGRWELRTTLSGPIEDRAAPTIDTP